MYFYLNLFRVAFYVVLAGAHWTNEVPLWVPLAWFCYDMVWPKYVKVPFTSDPSGPKKGNGVQYQAPDEVDLANLLKIRGGLNSTKGTIQ